MNFSEALEKLKEGKRIKRAIWGGYWFLSDPGDKVEGDVKLSEGQREVFRFKTLIVAKLKDSDEYVPAMPYQADLLAEDWEVVE